MDLTQLHSAHVSSFRQNDSQILRDNQESLFRKSLNKSNLRKGRDKVSLVFLSTFMQVEHAQGFSLHNQTYNKKINKTEPVQFNIQSRDQQKQRDKRQKQRRLNQFYQTKMQEIQKDQRSIIALVGPLDLQKKPNKKLLTDINETFCRARTLKTIPVSHRQEQQKRKKIYTKKRMVAAFQQFTIGRNRFQTQPTSITPQKVKNQVNNKAKLNLVQSMNITKILKNDKLSERKNKTEHAKVKRLAFYQPLNLIETKKSKNIEIKQFRWTQIGNKRTFNLKSMQNHKL